MAKAKLNIDNALLAQVVSGEVKFLSASQGNDMVLHNPPLIEVNVQMLDPTDPNKAAVRATAAAAQYLAANTQTISSGDVGSLSKVVVGNYAILTNAVLPEPKKRGNSFGSGAPTKYPFADMPVGGAFFSANSEHAKGDALKALGSTVSSQNKKYSSPTSETKTQKRAERDDNNNPILDAQGNKVIKTVTLPILKYDRKFTIRAVEAGKKYGEWTAPADGALIARTV